MIILGIGLLLGLSACVPKTPLATLDAGQSGQIAFATQTLSAQQFLTGDANGKQGVISGKLRLPKSDEQRVPAVLLVHGSSGVSPKHHQWAARLTRAGFATFLIDSFSGRGIIRVTEDQSQLSTQSMIYDAYRALELLATHPRIDPRRIAIMGFSRGGIVALYSALARFQRLHGPPGLTFAAHLPFYPFCNYTYRELEALTDSPIRIFHGQDDDYTPISSCQAQVKLWQQAGKDVQLIAYTGAHHAFDNSRLSAYVNLAEAQNAKHCFLIEIDNGIFLNQDTGKRFRFEDSCMTRGATVGYDPRAAKQSIQDVKAFLTKTLQ